ncbi:hypothetical protein [Cellulomonas sp. RIT-PI-Y]|uniref:immunity protein TriTu family protein n=1 Tax=Cellulomonas sp. RIT-PI-Y TaxID=3035297 RepID=UPI0021DB0B5E|nr:hypothetical protein [Cellulomonas sp. RIT-PI-Y]
MLNLIESMARWFDENSSAEGVRASYREGPVDRPKRSAQIGFETAASLASVAVWESGELEAEVLVVESLERVLVISMVVSTPASMIQIIERVMEATRAASGPSNEN